MDDPETVSSLKTQDTGQINVTENRRAIKNGRSRDSVIIGHIRHRIGRRKNKATG